MDGPQTATLEEEESAVSSEVMMTYGLQRPLSGDEGPPAYQQPPRYSTLMTCE